MTSSDMQALALEPPEPLDVVVTPTSPSSGFTRSRFEFETGKGNEGTKILMVEWDASTGKQPGGSKSDKVPGDWEVSWEGKGAVLPIRDVDPEEDSNIRRVYFLLPPGAPIPPLVSITPPSTKGAGNGNTRGDAAATILHTKPMPAIFPVELAGKQEAGRRGVLHTIWARRRLAELQEEIEAEMRENGESVGLEMAMQERQWIVDHFGLTPDPETPQPTKLHIPQGSARPTGPRSPVGGRLGEKLRGLKLATSPAELAAATQAAKSAQAPRTEPLVTAISPPATGIAASASGSGVGSLNAIMGGAAPATVRGGTGDDTNEEDLFALPMSPRSPEMKKSPFSIL
ncbi:hypothetical protein VTI74DRAFT_8586 [Chaetomium olivicolor]